MTDRDDLRVIDGGGRKPPSHAADEAAWRKQLQDTCDRIIDHLDRAITRGEPRLRLLREESLPADVPPHQRGFGVMDDGA